MRSRSAGGEPKGPAGGRPPSKGKLPPGAGGIAQALGERAPHLEVEFAARVAGDVPVHFLDLLLQVRGVQTRLGGRRCAHGAPPSVEVRTTIATGPSGRLPETFRSS